jgi:hypothetical protein
MVNVFGDMLAPGSGSVSGVFGRVSGAELQTMTIKAGGVRHPLRARGWLLPLRSAD